MVDCIERLKYVINHGLNVERAYTDLDHLQHRCMTHDKETACKRIPQARENIQKAKKQYQDYYNIFKKKCIIKEK